MSEQISREDFLKREMVRLRRSLPEAEDFLYKYDKAVANNEENTEDFAANFKISTMSFYLASVIKYVNYKKELEEIRRLEEELRSY